MVLFYLILLNLSISLIAGNSSSKSNIYEPSKESAQIDGIKSVIHTQTIPAPKTFTCYSQLPRELHYIIADYAGLNSPQGNSDSSLLQSYIQNNDFHALTTLLNCGALINGTTPKTQIAPLHLAAENLELSYRSTIDQENRTKNALKIMQVLMIKGADLNQQSPDWLNYTVLHVIGHSPLVLSMLIKFDANLNIKNKREETPLDTIQRLAMSTWIERPMREKFYKSSEILKKAGAKSSVELEPMLPIPTFEEGWRKKQHNDPLSSQW